jgi:hypothetical protein
MKAENGIIKEFSLTISVKTLRTNLSNHLRQLGRSGLQKRAIKKQRKNRFYRIPIIAKTEVRHFIKLL